MRGAEWLDGEQVACLYAVEALGLSHQRSPGTLRMRAQATAQCSTETTSSARGNAPSGATLNPSGGNVFSNGNSYNNGASVCLGDVLNESWRSLPRSWQWFVPQYQMRSACNL